MRKISRPILPTHHAHVRRRRPTSSLGCAGTHHRATICTWPPLLSASRVPTRIPPQSSVRAHNADALSRTSSSRSRHQQAVVSTPLPNFSSPSCRDDGLKDSSSTVPMPGPYFVSFGSRACNPASILIQSASSSSLQWHSPPISESRGGPRRRWLDPMEDNRILIPYAMWTPTKQCRLLYIPRHALRLSASHPWGIISIPFVSMYMRLDWSVKFGALYSDPQWVFPQL